MTRYKNLRKVNERGEFQPFPGVTVISNAFDNNPELCEQIYNCISSIEGIRDYYALLPFQSYHMTSFGVCTKRYDGGKDWNGLIEKGLSYFQNLDSCFEANKFIPEVTFKRVERECAIQVMVNLPPNQNRVITGIANQFDRMPEIPSEFHITLAYRYNMSAHIPKKIWIQIQDNIIQVVKDHDPINLAPPRLCYFNSMTEYVPWDGKANPFISSSPTNYSRRSPALFGSQESELDSSCDSENILPLSYKLK